LLKRVLVIVVATVMPFVMGSAFLTSWLPSQTVPAMENPLPAKTSQPSSATDDDDADADVLGNPVSDAVAKYKFDATGSLYELHSPQTELPRLADPKS
jgi:hypothetical protein